MTADILYSSTTSRMFKAGIIIGIIFLGGAASLFLFFGDREIPEDLDMEEIHTVNNLPTHPLHVGDAVLRAAVADTMSKRYRGLSGVEHLEDDEGMLFLFDIPARHGFVMRGMRIGLDFVWIYNWKVIGITPDVKAPENSEEEGIAYYPPEPVDAVLEIPAGAAERLGIREGDIVTLP